MIGGAQVHELDPSRHAGLDFDAVGLEAQSVERLDSDRCLWGGVHDTGVTPSLAFTQGGGTDVEDAANNKLANFAPTVTTDAVLPFIAATCNGVRP